VNIFIYNSLGKNCILILFDSPINAQDTFLECGALTTSALIGVISAVCEWGSVKIQISVMNIY
jgi:hypothetical protein